MDFATFNIKGYKKGLVGISKHIDRDGKELKKSGSFEDEAEKRVAAVMGFHIDPSKSHLNEEWVDTGGQSIAALVEKRIAEGYRLHKAIRSDAIKALGLIMTGSHDRMKEIESNEKLFLSWKKANWDFACKEFGGAKNIVRFTIHRDETTPHIHCVVVPITSDGRLSAKHYRDGKAKLQGYQDRYGEAMKPFGLERGIESTLTGRKHEEVQDYYKRMNRIERGIEQSTKYINSLNPLNRGKAKAALEAVQATMSGLEGENRRLKQEVAYAQNTQQTIISNQSKQALDRIKREVNLIQLAASMGYVLDKEKSSKTWAVMDREGDKILIKNSPNQEGHWMYKSLSDEREKGTIVDFMLKRGFGYPCMRGLISSHLDGRILEEQKKLSVELKDEKGQTYVAQSFLAKVVEHNQGNYLQSRGIQRDTYAPFQGQGLKVGDQAVFALYEGLNAQGEGKICSTISYRFTLEGTDQLASKKYFQKGLPRGLAVLKEPHASVSKIVVTESPIDALSHKQIHNEPAGTMYLSTCGSLTGKIKGELRNVFAATKEHDLSIVLAFDNDKPGKQMQKEISSMAHGQLAKTQVSVPMQGKDWNQLLQIGLTAQEKAKLRKMQQDLASSGQEYELRKKQDRGPNVLGMEVPMDF